MLALSREGLLELLDAFLLLPEECLPELVHGLVKRGLAGILLCLDGLIELRRGLLPGFLQGSLVDCVQLLDLFNVRSRIVGSLFRVGPLEALKLLLLFVGEVLGERLYGFLVLLCQLFLNLPAEILERVDLVFRRGRQDLLLLFRERLLLLLLETGPETILLVPQMSCRHLLEALLLFVEGLSHLGLHSRDDLLLGLDKHLLVLLLQVYTQVLQSIALLFTGLHAKLLLLTLQSLTLLLSSLLQEGSLELLEHLSVSTLKLLTLASESVLERLLVRDLQLTLLVLECPLQLGLPAGLQFHLERLDLLGLHLCKLRFERCL